MFTCLVFILFSVLFRFPLDLMFTCLVFILFSVLFRFPLDLMFTCLVFILFSVLFRFPLDLMFTCFVLHLLPIIWLIKNPFPVYLPYMSCYQHFLNCPLYLLSVLVFNHQFWFFPLTVLKMAQVECRNIYVVLVLSQLACIDMSLNDGVALELKKSNQHGCYLNRCSASQM